MEKDQEPRSVERNERERRQFFKIKAVKPNLQVYRRKRVEVVKILVCCIRARNSLLSPFLLSSLSFLFLHPSCTFRATSFASRPRPPLPVVKLPHETFLMSNRGDLRLSFLFSFSLSLFLPFLHFPLPPPPLQLFLFLSPSVGLSLVSYFCGPFSCLPLPSCHRSIFRGSLFPLLFFRVLPPPNFVADARTTAMVAATLAIVRKRSAECRITSGCDAINARIMFNIASLIQTT